MYSFDKGGPVRKPHVRPEVFRGMARVHVVHDGYRYALEVPEAMALANRLVDAAEEAERLAAE